MEKLIKTPTPLTRCDNCGTEGVQMYRYEIWNASRQTQETTYVFCSDNCFSTFAPNINILVLYAAYRRDSILNHE